MVYDEVTSCDLDQLNASFLCNDEPDYDLVKRYRYRLHIRLANAKLIQADKLGTKLFMHSLVLDLSGFTRKHFGSLYRDIVMEVIGGEQFSVNCVFILNIPY